MNITIANRLRDANIDIKSPQKVYDILRNGIIGKMSIKSTDKESFKLYQLQSQQKKILKLFESECIVQESYLKTIGVNC
jgi:stress response protein YsnF